jgi:protein-tyrosine phosphatase
MTPQQLETVNQLLAENAGTAQVKLLMDFVPDPDRNDVPDPYYDDNFAKVYELIDQGTNGLLETLTHQLVRHAELDSATHL